MNPKAALQGYLDNPTLGCVLHVDPDYLIVKDAYPKALRHYLVLPRDPAVTHVHPLIALADPAFRAKMESAAEVAKDLMVQSLVAEGLMGPAKAAQSEFRQTFLRAGVHRVPSMANLHIHVLTQDFHLPRMKTRKHYLSFTTDFFVGLETFARAEPLQSDSSAGTSEADCTGSDEADNGLSGYGLFVKRRVPPRGPSRQQHLVCTSCGASVPRFSTLKAHLAQEFAARFGPAAQRPRDGA